MPWEIEQPPPDTLVPPNVPTMDEPGRLPKEDRSNEEIKGPTFQERTKADSREAAVEAVRKMTASSSSLESSAKSGHAEKGQVGTGTLPMMGSCTKG